MDERRGMLVEFMVLALLVVGMVAALVLLTISGFADSQVAGTLGHLVETGFGAVIALAYAARGLQSPRQAAPRAPEGDAPRGPAL